MLPRPLPTPVLAFAIRHLGCVAGVMVTASHNPPQDNGYKVYLGDGSQIVPPADAEIAAGSPRSGRSPTCPRGDAGTVLDDDVVDGYLATVAGLAGDGPARPRPWSTRRCTASAATSVPQVLERPASPRRTSSTEQAEPDPDFPTVAFPNPEEPGAMDLAMALAEEIGADLVVANDPDADRCAVAVPGPARLADAARRRGGRAARRTTCCRRASRAPSPTSIVSSSLLGRWPRPPGSRTPRPSPASSGSAGSTGSRSATRRRSATASTPSTCGTRTASPRCCCCASWPRQLKAEGRTLVDLLDDIAAAHGLHATDQLSVRVDDLSVIARRDGRGCAPTPPTALGGLAVEQVDDLAVGTPTCRRRTGCATGSPTAPGSSSAQRHGAQAQVLPGGRGAGAPRGRRRRGPDLRGRPAGRRRRDGIKAAAGI